jgi:hypothetical protein
MTVRPETLRPELQSFSRTDHLIFIRLPPDGLQIKALSQALFRNGFFNGAISPFTHWFVQTTTTTSYCMHGPCGIHTETSLVIDTFRPDY